MPLHLKKVYKMNTEKNSDEYYTLCHTSAEIHLLKQQIENARRELVETVTKRNRIIQKLLLEECNFELGMADRILFYDQTGEIRVFKETTIDDSLIE